MEIAPDNWEGFILETTLEDTASDSMAADDNISALVPGTDSGEIDVGISEEILSGSGIVAESDGTPDGSGEPEQSEGEPDPEEGTADEAESLEEFTEEMEEEPISYSPALLSDEPLAVYIVEPEEEAVAQSVGGIYPGTISTTYLDYFAGIVDKLGFNEHYVAFRSGQYEYILAWGEGLEYNGYEFKGSAIDYCRIYSSSTSYSSYMVDFGNDTVYLIPETGFVYSDLGNFPTLTEGGTRIEFWALLFAVGFAVVYSVCHDIFDYIMEHVYRK